MNALEMEFEDNTFDLVWACESGEHMPDKKAYVEEMVRVLKPGGKIVIDLVPARDQFTEKEKSNLKFLYEEWAHPYFSYEEYERLLQGTGTMSRTASEDWVKNTLVSWRHSIWVGVWDPWPVVFAGPRQWYKVVRERHPRRKALALSGLMTARHDQGHEKSVSLSILRGRASNSSRQIVIAMHSSSFLIQGRLSERLEFLGESLDLVGAVHDGFPSVIPNAPATHAPATSSTLTGSASVSAISPAPWRPAPWPWSNRAP